MLCGFTAVGFIPPELRPPRWMLMPGWSPSSSWVLVFGWQCRGMFPTCFLLVHSVRNTAPRPASSPMPCGVCARESAGWSRACFCGLGRMGATGLVGWVSGTGKSRTVADKHGSTVSVTFEAAFLLLRF